MAESHRLNRPPGVAMCLGLAELVYLVVGRHLSLFIARKLVAYAIMRRSTLLDQACQTTPLSIMGIGTVQSRIGIFLFQKLT